MPAKKSKPKKPKAAPALVITRIFDAPRALVFAAWTKPTHQKKWSAPNGFTLPVSEGDPRPGGSWRAVMRTPDGEDLALSGVYQEVVPDRRLVFTHGWDENGHHRLETIVTVIFSDLRGKTKMIFRQAQFENSASREGHRGGWIECFDRLTAFLKKTLKSRTVPYSKRQVVEKSAH